MIALHLNDEKVLKRFKLFQIYFQNQLKLTEIKERLFEVITIFAACPEKNQENKFLKM